jgi:hypothetical protein
VLIKKLGVFVSARSAERGFGKFFIADGFETKKRKARFSRDEKLEKSIFEKK